MSQFYNYVVFKVRQGGIDFFGRSIMRDDSVISGVSRDSQHLPYIEFPDVPTQYSRYGADKIPPTTLGEMTANRLAESDMMSIGSLRLTTGF